MLHFASVITLLVEKTNSYYRQYLDTLDDGPSPLPDVTETEMFVSGDYCSNMTTYGDSLVDYWSAIEQFITPNCKKKLNVTGPFA
jgi:hypothetical protein